MKIALFYNEKKHDSKNLASEIVKFFKNKKIDIFAEDEKATLIDAHPLEQIKKSEITFIITIGGDGTILKHLHEYKDFDAAILGVNLGSLGFMADIPKNDVFSSLQDLLDGSYYIEKKIMLEGLFKENKVFASANDIVFHRGKNSSLIDLKVSINGKYLNTFAADGLIIATPNGSTAYSLSAGGPILSPDLDGFVLTPICPHTISNRPFVFSASSQIEIEYLSQKEHPIEVNVDGYVDFEMDTKDIFKLQKSQKTFKLVKLKKHDYFTTLKTKLNWVGKFN